MTEQIDPGGPVRQESAGSQKASALNLTKLGPALAVILIVATVGIVTWWDEIRAAVRGPTYGTIYVDSPEVYTRERLVNDRFRQETWLLQQLVRTDELMKEGRFDGIEGRRLSNVTRLLNAAAGLGLSENPEEMLSTVKEATQSDDPALSAAPLEVFQDAQNYREAIRTELMSTQLDDRHDIEGNTLYRLNFDAAIAPGNNTTAAAVVEVTLEEDQSSFQNYMNLYSDWHAYLQTEIDKSVSYQTLDLLQRGQALNELDKLVLRESLERQICEVIAELTDAPKETGLAEQNDSIDFACQSIERELLQEAIGTYVYSYMESLKQQNNLKFILTVADQVGDLGLKELPSVLGEAIAEARSIEAQNPDQSSTQFNFSGRQREQRQSRGTIERAVSFAESATPCRAPAQEQRSNILDSEATFSVPSIPWVQLPCPQRLRPHEPVLGAITMLERLKRLEAEPRSGEYTVPHIIARIKPGADADCKSDRPFDKLICQETVPAVRPNLVWEAVAETVRAKLNDELSSVKVTKGIEEFFEAAIRGCELNACALVLTPRKPGKHESCEDDDTPDDKRPYWCKLSRVLRAKASAFSYAVTPTQMVQRLGSEDATRMNLQAALRTATRANGAALDAVLSSVYDLDERIELRHRHPVVVGFGSPYQGKLSAERTMFGWVIRPRLVPRTSRQEDSIRQVTQHYPLSAVVSVPSWWRSLRLTVRTAWVDSDDDWGRLRDVHEVPDDECKEEPGSHRTCREHVIQVPGSVKEINHKLKYEVIKEPYIDSNAEPTKLYEQVLEVGKRGEIILQGGRLWRSTVVTVGQQRATSIVVLPDMNGVIAEFLCVEPPQNGEEEQFVTVWTSEGRTRTPFKVRLRGDFSERCPNDKPG